MTSPPAVADLAAAIIAEPAPIVFLDTAAILDILRASFRHEIKANVVESAVDLTEASLATPKRLWLVAPDIVMGEFDNHREKVKKEMVSHLKRFSETIARVHEISKIVFAEWQFAAVDLIEMGLKHASPPYWIDLLWLQTFSAGATCATRMQDVEYGKTYRLPDPKNSHTKIVKYSKPVWNC
jgi:hypothetical protein